MIKENQLIDMKWNPRNRKWFESLGYTFTKWNDVFKINVFELSKGSNVKVCLICDYCGKEYYTTYTNYLKTLKVGNGKDCCKACSSLKQKDTCMDRYGVCATTQLESVKRLREENNIKKYGVPHTLQNKEVRDKINQTVKEKYGVDYISQLPEIQEKIKNTNIEKFGCSSVFQNEEIKERIKDTNINKFGVDNPAKSEQVKEKIKKTCLDKYGYEHTLQVPEIRTKGRQTLYKNGKTPTSKQQLAIYNILLEEFDNCELNYPKGVYSLDCMLNINDCKIDIEYDGWYWHQDKQEHDNKRDAYIIKEGYKILRIKANKKDTLPTKEQLKEAIDYLVKGNHGYTEINMNI